MRAKVNSCVLSSNPKAVRWRQITYPFLCLYANLTCQSSLKSVLYSESIQNRLISSNQFKFLICICIHGLSTPPAINYTASNLCNDDRLCERHHQISIHHRVIEKWRHGMSPVARGEGGISFIQSMWIILIPAERNQVPTSSTSHTEILQHVATAWQFIEYIY